jgi:hypothetical protein
MDNERKVNPDELCQAMLTARMEHYRAKEMVDASSKKYNDAVDAMGQVIQMMKNRILELEKGKEQDSLGDKK